MWHSKKFHMWFVHICTYTVFHILYVHILYLHMGLLVISKWHILIPKWLKRSIANEAQNVIYDTCVPTISKRMCCHDSVSSCCVLILTLGPCVSPLFQFRPCVFSWVSWFSYFQPVRIKLALDSPPPCGRLYKLTKGKWKVLVSDQYNWSGRHRGRTTVPKLLWLEDVQGLLWGHKHSTLSETPTVCLLHSDVLKIISVGQRVSTATPTLWKQI